jgi:membrane protein DedA with SNARE-associated domain
MCRVVHATVEIVQVAAVSDVTALYPFLQTNSGGVFECTSFVYYRLQAISFGSQFLSFHSVVPEDSVLLQYATLSLGEQLPTFRTNVVSVS